MLFYLVSLLCPLITSIWSHMQWFLFLFDIKFPMPHGMSFSYDSPFWIIPTMRIQQRSLVCFVWILSIEGYSSEVRPENHYSTLEFKICNAFLLFYLALFHPFIAFPSFFQQIFILYLLYVRHYSDNRTVSKRVTNSLLSYSFFR